VNNTRSRPVLPERRGGDFALDSEDLDTLCLIGVIFLRIGLTQIVVILTLTHLAQRLHLS
jgi:hypothetical protein